MLTTHIEECGRMPVAQMNTPLEPSRAGGEAKRPLRRAISRCRDQRSRDRQSCWRLTGINRALEHRSGYGDDGFLVLVQ